MPPSRIIMRCDIIVRRVSKISNIKRVLWATGTSGLWSDNIAYHLRPTCWIVLLMCFLQNKKTNCKHRFWARQYFFFSRIIPCLPPKQCHALTIPNYLYNNQKLIGNDNKGTSFAYFFVINLYCGKNEPILSSIPHPMKELTSDNMTHINLWQHWEFFVYPDAIEVWNPWKTPLFFWVMIGFW